MAILRVKDSDGNWVEIPAIVGVPGKDGTVKFSDLTEEQRKSLRGEPGDPGYSPIRGNDYWTNADIAEIKSYVDNAILGGAW